MQHGKSIFSQQASTVRATQPKIFVNESHHSRKPFYFTKSWGEEWEERFPGEKFLVRKSVSWRGKWRDILTRRKSQSELSKIPPDFLTWQTFFSNRIRSSEAWKKVYFSLYIMFLDPEMKM